jgi:predicted flap endonuclease-1-like 5' DNA nuclease
MPRVPPAWVRSPDGLRTPVDERLEEANRKMQTDVARERLQARVTGSWPTDAIAARIEFTEEQLAQRRISPRRNRWRDIAEFDSRIASLEQKQTRLTDEISGLQEQRAQAEETDREALARWVADEAGPRPTPTLPAIEERITELGAERDALTAAVANVLNEKAGYVERHRRRLVRDAEKARRRAVERFQAAVTAVEEARQEVADSVATQRWATEYPSEDADATSLRLHQLKGGRLTDAIPEFKGLALMSQLAEWMRQDAAWLDGVLAREEEARPLDPHEAPIWEDTEEGREAMRLANRRILEGLRPRHTREAGWGD